MKAAKYAYLFNKLRQRQGCSVNGSIVILEVHFSHLLLCNPLRGVFKYCVLLKIVTEETIKLILKSQRVHIVK